MSGSTGRRRRHVAVVVAAVLVLAAAVGWAWRGPAEEQVSAGHGEGSEAEACGPVQRAPVGGAGRHVDDTEINYSAAPPAFGDHRSRWEVRASSFYDVEDRPEVAVLVHNLEHGYNILWYDQSVVDDGEALARVREIAEEYASLGRTPDPSTAFIAVPWTAEDGPAFPEGMRFALTHWYADPDDRSRSRDDEVGLTRYCSSISAETVADWMRAYPLSDAPEGYPDLM